MQVWVRVCKATTEVLLEAREAELQGTYILVLHVFEQPQLSVRSLCVDDGLERSGQLFHRYL